MKHLYTLLLLALTFSANAQISFSNQTTLLNDPTGFRSGVAVAVADMNADGLDDIIRLGQGNMLSVEYQSAPNLPFANYTHGSITGDAWAMVVADVNNDGWNDILAGGAYDGVKVLANNGGTDFTTAFLTDPPGGGTFVQGSNFADINNDGWLDAFTCHDDGESRIWGNDGTGTFILHDEWIDMATSPASDNSGNYGSVWTDFDNDRDLDLYIAKCRQGVDNPNDPRRINALFVNDGNPTGAGNNYSEQAGKYGLKIGWQSWTSDFQDIDNDGDMDCLVTNHDYPLQLLINDGAGHFTDIAPAAGVDVSGTFLQGLLRDFDNDGFVDIITVGNFQPSEIATHLFHNNGNLTFTAIANPFGTPSLGSLAVGDLNGDGFQDIYAAYQSSFNNPSNTPDRLWMNTTANGNNYIAFDLHGTESNRMGVGARVEIHGQWGIQVREVRAGESYGIQNSLTQYFGIGTDIEVEYAVVHWPSGRVDVIRNPPINQKNTVTEGQACTLPNFDLGNGGSPTVLCAGQSISVEAPAGYDYLWSNGSVSQSLTLSEPGNYSVVIVDAQGCAAASNVFSVLVSPDETPTLTANSSLSFCEGESVVLTSSEAQGYLWSTGENTQSITVTQPGSYTVTAQGFCGEYESQPMQVEVLPSVAPTTSDVSIPAPGTAVLEADGDNLTWYDSPFGNVALGTGESFTTPFLTADDTFYVQNTQLYNDWEFAIGMGAHQGSNFYNGSNFNGQTQFETLVPLVIEQVTVYADQAGLRTIELRTEAGDLLASFPIDVQVGKNDVPLNFQVSTPGQYRLLTNPDVNMATLGYLSPRLYRSNQGVSYPYVQPDLMSITGSDLGSGFYYYFYDWQIAVIPIACPSERIPVIVSVGTSTTGEQQLFGRVEVSPNPSSGLFVLEMETFESGMASVSVTDLSGQVVFGEKFEAMAHVAQRRSIDLTKLPAGMYFLKVTNGDRSGYAKLVVE
jgi:ASPIC and UnbV/Secretion system C-terminal sorting domain/FG-GAP-like repeat/Ig-like domain CHU_C associated